MAVFGSSSEKTVIGDVAAAFAGKCLRPAQHEDLQPGGGDPTSTFTYERGRLTV
jgi:hypothetical protein